MDIAAALCNRQRFKDKDVYVVIYDDETFLPFHEIIFHRCSTKRIRTSRFRFQIQPKRGFCVNGIDGNDLITTFTLIFHI